MDTRIPFIFLLISLSTSVLISNERGSNAYNRNIFRKKRQTGYMYEKPSISFDLPSRTTSIPATTQTQIVNQMQMYYAYPVPSVANKDVGPSSSTGILDTEPITSTGTSGYNYQNQPRTEPVKTDGNIDYSNSGSQIVSGSGYNYEKPTIGMNDFNGNQKGVSYTSSGSGGYGNQNIAQTGNSYQNQNNIMQRGYTAKNVISTTKVGYDYKIPGIDTRQTGNTENIGYSSNGATSNSRGIIQGSENTAKVGAVETGAFDTSGGYNYNVQNAGIMQAVGNTVNGPETIATSTAGGYYYEKQNIGSNQMDENTVTVGISDIGPNVPESSDGYNNNIQSTGISQANGNNVNIGSGSGNSGTRGYSNYQSQPININQSDLNTDVGDSGYSYERQNFAVSQPVIKQEESSVSTSAPTYLPPIQSVDRPTESYLLPQLKQISAIQTVTSKAPTVNTNSPFLPKPPLSSNYLTPPMVNPTLGVTGLKPTVQTPVKYIPPKLPSVKPSIPNRTYITPNIEVNQDSNKSTNLLNDGQPTQHLGSLNGHQYLPPSNLYSPTVSPPASTYLPPV
ncbi:uncharacterized protein DDB_G0283357-like [Pieris napi]|uniref:uncharacterized protein DDB_G0283357-like n=1 Tax=Pieris napi TaxID=78633 RepID=UPI001FBA41DF|nr:uncharacterized protein DDB_G0283357-like [Pieris napi]